jgi:hypothetical protein
VERHHLTSRVACAWAAFVVGTAYALVSVGWALGSTWALDTVGGALEARAGSPALTALLWATVLLKLTAAGLGLAVVLPRIPPRRPVVLAAWAAAVVLNVYGGALTLGGLLVQADVLHASQDADHYAMAWHTYFWDPWFLVWGLLLTAALWRSRTQQAIAASFPIREQSIR